MFRANSDYELEICLGLEHDYKKPQLPADIALQLCMMLTKSAKEGHFVQEDRLFVDYFYENGTVRNRTFVNALQQPEAIRKTRVAKRIAICKERQFVFHINLKQEAVLDHFDTVKAGAPCHVRVQREWVFLYKNAVSYVIKRVRSGKTTKEECLQSTPHYEVEIELLRDAPYWSKQSDFQIATSLIHKALDLCGRFKDNGEREELTFQLLDQKDDDPGSSVDNATYEQINKPQETFVPPKSTTPARGTKKKKDTEQQKQDQKPKRTYKKKQRTENAPTN